MGECIFCGIAAKKIPASVVYEDKDIIAFMDINPLSEGHTLVVPKRHSELVYQMGKNEAGALMEAAHTVSAAIRKSGIPCDGINFVVSDGRAAGQEVPHVHMHLIPRLSGDGYEVINWKTRQKLDTARIFAVAERITAALASTN